MSIMARQSVDNESADLLLDLLGILKSEKAQRRKHIIGILRAEIKASGFRPKKKYSISELKLSGFLDVLVLEGFISLNERTRLLELTPQGSKVRQLLLSGIPIVRIIEEGAKFLEREI